MTESELYKFVEKSNSEWHWEDNIHKGLFNEVYLFIHVYDITEFMLLLGTIFLTNTDTEVVIKDKYFVFKMEEICEYFDIEMEKVFSRE